MVKRLVWDQETVGSSPTEITNTRMLELVDNEDLKSFALGRTGSSPVASTK